MNEHTLTPQMCFTDAEHGRATPTMAKRTSIWSRDPWVVLPCRHPVRFCGPQKVRLASHPVPAPATSYKSSVARAHTPPFALSVAPNSPATGRARSSLFARVSLTHSAHFLCAIGRRREREQLRYAIARVVVGATARGRMARARLEKSFRLMCGS